jgi:peptidoglycan hydrolase-like protein with peptidoglycan-binding domain
MSVTGGPHRVGSRGLLVRKLQESLSALGYGITVDGEFGEETEEAVSLFQSEHDLDETGVVDRATANAINEALADLAEDQENAEDDDGERDDGAANRILRQGMRGDSVKALQKLLRDLEYDIAVHGIFDEATKKAVVNFQKEEGLNADGVVGPTTFRAIMVSLRGGGEVVHGDDERNTDFSGGEEE